MTKAWDTYESIIKELYAKHTLATVQKTMERDHGFKASIRAYRQKFDAWGCSKYKKREKTPSTGSRSDSGSKRMISPSTRTLCHERTSPGPMTSRTNASATLSDTSATWSPLRQDMPMDNSWTPEGNVGSYQAAPDSGHAQYYCDMNNNIWLRSNSGFQLVQPAFGQLHNWDGVSSNGTATYATTPATNTRGRNNDQDQYGDNNHDNDDDDQATDGSDEGP